jgi:hypothetical protein
MSLLLLSENVVRFDSIASAAKLAMRKHGNLSAPIFLFSGVNNYTTLSTTDGDRSVQ